MYISLIIQLIHFKELKMKKFVTINNSELILLSGDITDLNYDVIVNAANQNLQLGGGVAGAIRNKGGEEIQKECDKIGRTYVGGAVLTNAGKLKAKYIIHAVGPRMGEGEEEIKLKNATMNSLLLAEEHNQTSIAFPAISTGIFGYPVGKCAEIMLKVIIEYLKRPTCITKVAICLWGEENYEFFYTQLKSMIN
jgi:O-acetyl-ADP-ribose deacetylase (regulator of RNase III)